MIKYSTPEIKEWLKKYCKLHSFCINKNDVPMKYKTRDGRIVDNKNFIHTTQSYRNRHDRYGYWDKITKAFNFINECSNGQNR